MMRNAGGEGICVSIGLLQIPAECLASAWGYSPASLTRWRTQHTDHELCLSGNGLGLDLDLVVRSAMLATLINGQANERIRGPRSAITTGPSRRKYDTS